HACDWRQRSSRFEEETAAAAVELEPHRYAARSEEFIDRFRASETALVIVDDDGAAGDDMVVQMFETHFRRFVPITVDSQQRDRSDGAGMPGQRVLEPSFDQS